MLDAHNVVSIAPVQMLQSRALSFLNEEKRISNLHPAAEPVRVCRLTHWIVHERRCLMHLKFRARLQGMSLDLFSDLYILLYSYVPRTVRISVTRYGFRGLHALKSRSPAESISQPWATPSRVPPPHPTVNLLRRCTNDSNFSRRRPSIL